MRNANVQIWPDVNNVLCPCQFVILHLLAWCKQRVMSMSVRHFTLASKTCRLRMSTSHRRKRFVHRRKLKTLITQCVEERKRRAIPFRNWAKTELWQKRKVLITLYDHFNTCACMYNSMQFCTTPSVQLATPPPPPILSFWFPQYAQKICPWTVQ